MYSWQLISTENYFILHLSGLTISIVRLAMTSILQSCSRGKASYAVESAFICIYSMIVEPLLRLLAFTIDLFILIFKILTKLSYRYSNKESVKITIKINSFVKQINVLNLMSKKLKSWYKNLYMMFTLLHGTDGPWYFECNIFRC